MIIIHSPNVMLITCSHSITRAKYYYISIYCDHILTTEIAASWSMVNAEGPATRYIDIAAQAESWVRTCCITWEWSRDGEVVRRICCVISSLETHATLKYLQFFVSFF